MTSLPPVSFELSNAWPGYEATKDVIYVDPVRKRPNTLVIAMRNISGGPLHVAKTASLPRELPQPADTVEGTLIFIDLRSLTFADQTFDASAGFRAQLEVYASSQPSGTSGERIWAVHICAQSSEKAYLCVYAKEDVKIASSATPFLYLSIKKLIVNRAPEAPGALQLPIIAFNLNAAEKPNRRLRGATLWAARLQAQVEAAPDIRLDLRDYVSAEFRPAAIAVLDDAVERDLRLILLPRTSLAINYSADTRFTLEIKFSETGENAGDLAKKEFVEKIKVKSTEWQTLDAQFDEDKRHIRVGPEDGKPADDKFIVNPQMGKSTEWTIGPITPSWPPGFPALRLGYEGVPGYADGFFELKLEKVRGNSYFRKVSVTYIENGRRLREDNFLRFTAHPVACLTPDATINYVHDGGSGLPGTGEIVGWINNKSKEHMFTSETRNMALVIIDNGRVCERWPFEIPYPKPTILNFESSSFKWESGEKANIKPIDDNILGQMWINVDFSANAWHFRRAILLWDNGETCSEMNISEKTQDDIAGNLPVKLKCSVPLRCKRIILRIKGAAPADVAEQSFPIPGADIEPGTIAMWHKSEPPRGWVMCDGAQTMTGIARPNLQGRFPRGADSQNLKFAEQGGSSEHKHRTRVDLALVPTRRADGKYFDVYAPFSGTSKIDAEVETATHLPPWTGVYFIMKL